MSTNQPSLTTAWLKVFAGTGVNLCLGVLYTWSVFAAALRSQLGWSATESQFPYTLACLIFAASMIPGGRLVDKIGPRWVVTVGALFVGAGMYISGASVTLTSITIGFGLFVGIAMGLGYAAPTPAAVKWFQPHKRGLIAGLVVAGFGGASIYTAPLTNYLLTTYGVKGTFFYLGSLFFIVMILLAQYLSVPPAGYIPYGGPPPKSNGSTPVASKKDYSPAEMVKTPQFYLLWLMFLFGASAGLMIIGHLATISNVQGGITWGFVLVAVLAIANAGGRIFFGWLSDKLGRSKTMFVVFAIQAINMFLFATYTSGATLLIGSVLTGAAYGACLSLFPSAVFDYFGLKNGGLNYSFVFTAWGVAALIGPIIAGRALDLTQSYQGGYTISAILMIVAAILALITKAPKPLEMPMDNRVTG
ncbi:Nitrate/nitrite transporter NarK [Desulfotomaculum arcticum]|uniref:Nitrate/nitrite transporter NarK n=1 Tax=Desulfotruncus arcticus DSM 17038 TaxID=1121424 RepID=A0A1I2QA59_9FIRM|nr:OFA family MFS transporter [Desulfotruncus arcticus]SFG25188.1 Nitrate/nitrite transporter NarK [Desulfotomaculum arcticum] [Desulfotruncus arcticus DSM 17038]